jgi:hypothetical protein
VDDVGYLTRAAFQRETGRTRREVDELLAAGLPHEVVGNGRGSEIRIDRQKSMKWLADRALNGRAAAAALPSPTKPPRPDFPVWIEAILDSVDTHVEQGWALGLMTAIYPLPAVVAAAAVRSNVGLSMDQVHELSGAVTACMVCQTFTDARKAGIEPFASSGADGPEILVPDAFWPVKWQTLAAEAGEPGWVPPKFNTLWPAPDGDDDVEDDGDGAVLA